MDRVLLIQEVYDIKMLKVIFCTIIVRTLLTIHFPNKRPRYKKQYNQLTLSTTRRCNKSRSSPCSRRNNCPFLLDWRSVVGTVKLCSGSTTWFSLGGLAKPHGQTKIILHFTRKIHFLIKVSYLSMLSICFSKFLLINFYRVL